MDNASKKRPLGVAGVKPEDFPLYSPESCARARAVLSEREEKQKTSLIPVMIVRIIKVGGDGNRPPMVVECRPDLIGSDWSSWMTRQELETTQRKYEEYQAAR
jgi:hypothetical protein